MVLIHPEKIWFNEELGEKAKFLNITISKPNLEMITNWLFKYEGNGTVILIKWNYKGLELRAEKPPMTWSNLIDSIHQFIVQHQGKDKEHTRQIYQFKTWEDMNTCMDRLYQDKSLNHWFKHQDQLPDIGSIYVISKSKKSAHPLIEEHFKYHFNI
eukprot:gene5938-7395_t